MSDQTYAITHIVGTSKTGVDDAIKNGITTARQSLRNLDWFEVEEIRGYIGDAEDADYVQVTMRVGLRYEPS